MLDKCSESTSTIFNNYKPDYLVSFIWLCDPEKKCPIWSGMWIDLAWFQPWLQYTLQLLGYSVLLAVYKSGESGYILSCIDFMLK